MIGQKLPSKLRAPWSHLPADQQVKANQEFNRRFLGTPDGKAFLALLLKDHFYFTKPQTPAEQALRDYATYFVSERLGITDHLQIVDALLDSAP